MNKVPALDIRPPTCDPYPGRSSRTSLMSKKKTPRSPAPAQPAEPSAAKKRTTVTLPASLHKATKQRALDDDCDFSDVVVAALREYLS
ncbi:hypothetical protein [Paraliomyxa miuraensis]|uniref:hypothetical protein n=1 Tax=Paraliomyxa miuraensis TaxID=376150 RepID=UPI00225A57AB|nr:hypothetical protein [Paraliomyxa miuraensis]MCX4239093.1 hypothetical protein [Paraliomyxa miuraensis]